MTEILPTPGPAPRGPAPPRVVGDATCLACGCLCDDIALAVDGGRIVEAGGACGRGLAWFFADHARADLPAAAIDGRPATVGEALDRAAAILAGARSPAVLGLTWAGVEAQRAAVALADRLGGRVDLGRPAGPTLAVQRVGRVSATLGEVKARADVVVFWFADPATTHPRHAERYSVEPRGRFLPDGRAGRTVVVVDDGARPNATAAIADLALTVPVGGRFEALWTLRALIKGLEVGPAADPLRPLASAMLGARYGAFFTGEGPASQAEREAALLLVRDLNRERARFVAMDLGAPGNAAGAEAVLTWQSGFPLGVDFSPDGPRPLAAWGAEPGEIDAALVVADDPGRFPGLRGRPVPTILLAPDATARPAAVAIRTATPGIDAAGTVVRVDGAWLPLRPPLGATLPADLELLAELTRRLDRGPDPEPGRAPLQARDGDHDR